MTIVACWPRSSAHAEEVAEMTSKNCARGPSAALLLDRAHRVANDNSMLLNYNQLSVPVISSVLNFFKVSPSAEELETIARTSEFTQKKLPARAFVADADAKQKLASDLVREAEQSGPASLINCSNRRRLERRSIMNATNLTTGKHVVATDFDGGEGILVDLNTKKILSTERDRDGCLEGSRKRQNDGRDRRRYYFQLRSRTR